MLPGHVLIKTNPFSRLPQDEENHEQTTDVRSQLRFFEQLERMEKQRKDEQEREILLKAAKVPKQKPVLCPSASTRREGCNGSACFRVDREPRGDVLPFTALPLKNKLIN